LSKNWSAIFRAKAYSAAPSPFWNMILIAATSVIVVPGLATWLPGVSR
jgi:hypothetical protein